MSDKLSTVNSPEEATSLTVFDRAMIKLLTIKSQKGVTMIEYALIASLVAVAAITALGLLGTQLGLIFEYIKGKLVVPSTPAS